MMQAVQNELSCRKGLRAREPESIQKAIAQAPLALKIGQLAELIAAATNGGKNGPAGNT